MKITLDLTPEELAVLKFVVPCDDDWGEPLKDFEYSYPDISVSLAYKALATLRSKMRSIKFDEEGSKMSHEPTWDPVREQTAATILAALLRNTQDTLIANETSAADLAPHEAELEAILVTKAVALADALRAELAKGK